MSNSLQPHAAAAAAAADAAKSLQSCPTLIVPALILGRVLLVLTTRCHYFTSLNTEIFLCNHLKLSTSLMFQ